MALAVSTASFSSTGTGNLYTVPSGKIIKVRVNYLKIVTGGQLKIGDYFTRNDTGHTVYSEYNGKTGTGSNENTAQPVNGFLMCLYTGGYNLGRYMWVKEDHILIAGQTIYMSVSSAIDFKITIFQEDA